MTDIDPIYLIIATLAVAVANVAAMFTNKITPPAFWRNLVILYAALALITAAQQEWASALVHVVMVGVYVLFYRMVRPVVRPGWWDGQHERIDNPKETT